MSLKTTTAEIALSPAGITQVRVFPNAKQMLTDAMENLRAAIQVGEGKRRPLLTDIRFCAPLAPEARRYYSGQVLLDTFTAMALLIDSSVFGTMMGNIYLGIAKPGVPTRLFTDEDKAVVWLKEYVLE